MTTIRQLLREKGHNIYSEAQTAPCMTPYVRWRMRTFPASPRGTDPASALWLMLSPSF
jgi:hypothetical protein